MLWVQKSVGEHNAKKAQYRDRTYLGPTPLSDFCANEGKATTIRREMLKLLDSDPSSLNSPFYAAWLLVPAAMVHELRRLVVSLVLVTVCSWDFRFTKKVGRFPLRLLTFVEKAHHESDKKNKK